MLKIARQALPDSKSRENNSGAVLSYLRQFMPGSLVHAWLQYLMHMPQSLGAAFHQILVWALPSSVL